MATELEIKLTASASNTGNAYAWLSGLANTAGTETLQLGNTYYDTPAGDLNARMAALRIRRVGDQFIQTLKTRGEFVGGAHLRQEWEWPLRQNRLDLHLLADTPASQIADSFRLTPVFETNFERRVVIIKRGANLIEAAFDTGEIVAGDRARSLNEIEFEHKAGDASALLVWAQRLAEKVPVFLNLVSKAEQGYYLAGISQPSALLSPFKAETELGINDFLYRLSLSWLTGQPPGFSGKNLVFCARQAGERGQGETFNRLARSLLDGATVADLANDRALGQCQLALVAPSHL